MVVADNYVQVTPPELTFKFELKKSIPVALMLTNVTDDRVAFKVKTTSPKKYCVRPSSGVIEARSTKEVQVIMQPQREMPATFSDCKDKFLVQCVTVGASVTEAAPELFDAAYARDIKQTKLRVALLAPARPPSPVPEGNESEPTSPPQTQRGAPALGAGADAAGRDKVLIQQRLDSLQHGPSPSRSVAPVQAARPAPGYGVISLVLVALLAFVIGHFLQGPGLPALLERLKGWMEQVFKKHA